MNADPRLFCLFGLFSLSLLLLLLSTFFFSLSSSLFPSFSLLQVSVLSCPSVLRSFCPSLIHPHSLPDCLFFHRSTDILRLHPLPTETSNEPPWEAVQTDRPGRVNFQPTTFFPLLFWLPFRFIFFSLPHLYLLILYSILDFLFIKFSIVHFDPETSPIRANGTNYTFRRCIISHLPKPHLDDVNKGPIDRLMRTTIDSNRITLSCLWRPDSPGSIDPSVGSSVRRYHGRCAWTV